MSKKTVFVETPFLIWAIQGNCTPGQEAMQERARHALKLAVEGKMHLTISAVSLAEFLGGMPPEFRDAYEQEISQRFIVIPLDQKSARHAAGFQYEHFAVSLADEYKEQRIPLKADLLILGCAKSVDPQVMYCDDGKLVKLAGRCGIKACPLPDLPAEQPPLPFGASPA